MNLTLIGMAGAGKSYLGKQLAEKLGYRFVDIDACLEAAHGKPIQGILDDVGEDVYLDAEADMVVDATTEGTGLIVSPGGSVVYRDAAMRHLSEISRVVYIKVPFETVEARLKELPPRAIIGLGKKTLRELYDERHPLYEKYAHLTIEPSEMPSEAFVQKIVDFLRVPASV